MADPAEGLEVLCFGDFELNLKRGSLQRDGCDIPLRPKSFALLVELARRPGELISRQELIDAVWGEAEVTDAVLTQSVIDVRRALEDSQRLLLRTVPRRGFTFDAEVHHGPGPSQGSRPQPTSGSSTWPSAGLALVTVMLVATAVSVGLKWFQLSPPELVADQVEVVPWKVLDGDETAESIAAMAPAALALGLGQYGVASVMQNAQSTDKAAELQLRGTVRRQDESILVDVLVEDQRSRINLWSARFEAPAHSPGELVEQVAARTSLVVERGLFRRSLIPRTISPELFAMWLRSGDLAHRQQRVEYYEQVLQIVEVAPDDAASHAALAVALLRVAEQPGPVGMSGGLREQAQQAARRALEIDPDFAEALVVLAGTLPHGAWGEKEALLLQALSDARYKWTRTTYQAFLRGVGRLVEALHYSERSISVARTPNTFSDHAWLLAQTGRSDEALRILDDIEVSWPEDRLGPWRRFTIHAFFGSLNEAERLLQLSNETSIVARTGGVACWGPFLDARRGLIHALSRTQIEAHCRADTAWVVPRMLAALGDVDAVIEYVQEVYDDWESRGHPEATYFFYYPEMKPVRDDPRFLEMATASRLVEYWLDSDLWPDFCADPLIPYDCKSTARALVSERRRLTTRPTTREDSDTVRLGLD